MKNDASMKIAGKTADFPLGSIRSFHSDKSGAVPDRTGEKSLLKFPVCRRYRVYCCIRDGQDRR